jgi:uncharacterized membrane protein YjdF
VERTYADFDDVTATGVEKHLQWIAAGASIAVTVVSLTIAPPHSTYRWAFIFLVPFLWIPYLLRNRLALLPSHYALFAAGVLFHDLGALGSYDRIFFGLRFDTYVHFIFGVVGGLILAQALREKQRLSPTALWIAVPLFILGLGAIHELIECLSTIILGPQRGMLKLRPDEPFDTQKDLFNNLLGALCAMAWYALALKRRERAID